MATRLSLAGIVVGGALLAFAAPAQAGLNDGRCDGSLPSVFERTVQVQREQRVTLGLPSGRKHVVRVLREGRPWGIASLYVTKAEGRWLDQINPTVQRTAVVESYARKHASGSYGGTSTEARWPRPAYLVVRFTRDVARHRRALARRLDRPARVVKVRYAYSRLREVQDRIDPRVLAAEGIKFSSSAPDVRRNRVRLGVITARPDAAAVVRRLYGRAVRVDVVAKDDWRPICQVGDSYTLSEDGRELTIHYWSVPGYRFLRLELDESGPGVRVAVRELVPTTAHPLPCVFRSATIALAASLGDRKVVDAETGRNLPPGDGSPHRDCRDRYYGPPRT